MCCNSTNINEMNLSELKNIIYLNKKCNKLSDTIVDTLNNKIKNIILCSNDKESICDTPSDSASESASTTTTSDSCSTTDSDNKIHNENRKMYECLTSKKIFDRMASHAKVINEQQHNNKVEINYLLDNNTKKLGERKHIKIK